MLYIDKRVACQCARVKGKQALLLIIETKLHVLLCKRRYTVLIKF